MASCIRWSLWTVVTALASFSFYAPHSRWDDLLPYNHLRDEGIPTTTSALVTQYIHATTEDSEAVVDAFYATHDYNNPKGPRATPYSFTCQPKVPSQAKPRTPLIVFTTEHSGSHFVFQLLHEMATQAAAAHSDRRKQRFDEADFLNLHKLFGGGGGGDAAASAAIHLWTIAEALAQNCLGSDMAQLQAALAKRWVSKNVLAESPQETVQFLTELGRRSPNVAKLVEAYQNRRADVVGMLQYLSRLPSCFADPNQPPGFAVRFLDTELQLAHINPTTLISALHHRLNGGEDYDSEDGGDKRRVHFVILWRRQLLEEYVARERSKHNSKATTTMPTDLRKDATSTTSIRNLTVDKPPRVTVDRYELEKFFKTKQTYFKSLRDAFAKLEIPYHVVEYERDLSTQRGQRHTVKRLQQILGWTNSTTTSQDDDKLPMPTGSSRRKKHFRKVSVRELVSNWEDVQRWGYGDTNDRDLFWRG